VTNADKKQSMPSGPWQVAKAVVACIIAHVTSSVECQQSAAVMQCNQQ